MPHYACKFPHVSKSSAAYMHNAELLQEKPSSCMADAATLNSVFFVMFFEKRKYGHTTVFISQKFVLPVPQKYLHCVVTVESEHYYSIVAVVVECR